MRIAVAETEASGGLLHYAAQLADALGAAGHTVDLIVPRGNEVERLPLRVTQRARLIGPEMVPSAAGGEGRLAALARRALLALRIGVAWTQVAAVALRGRHDVLILNAAAHTAPESLGQWAASLAPRTRLAFICHEVWFERRRPAAEFVLSRACLRRAFPRAAVVFVHGERSRQDFERRWPSSTVVSIPHGDERLFAAGIDGALAPARGHEILFFGTWTEDKGMAVLLEAFGQVLESVPAARLTIAGHPLDQQIRDTTLEAARHFGDRVSVIEGYVDIADVPAIFARARVVATPYTKAAQSGVVNLAMTLGRAVVSSDAGDLPEAVIDGVSGRIVPRGDPGALARTLVELLEDPAEADRLGRNGHQRSRAETSWEAVAGLVVEALRAAPPDSGALPRR